MSTFHIRIRDFMFQHGIPSPPRLLGAFVLGIATMTAFNELHLTNHDVETRRWYLDILDQNIPLHLSYFSHFNFTRCCSDFKIFMYPVRPSEDWEMGMQVDWKWSDETLSDWRQQQLTLGTGLFTDAPDSACILIPETIPSHVETSRQKVALWLRRLEHWKRSNPNHVVIDVSDINDVGPWNLSGRKIAQNGDTLTTEPYRHGSLDAGYAMIMGSSLDSRAFRPFFDISIPLMLPGRDHQIRQYNEDPDLRRNTKDRQHLACFVGHIHSFTQIRKDIAALDDGDKFVIGKGNVKLYSKCRYVFVVRGLGYHSFRLLEALSFGAVPIILSDLHVLPFPFLIEWSRVGVVAPEAHALRIPKLLDQISNTEYEEKQRRVVELYEGLFATKLGIVSLAIEQIRKNVASQIVERGLCTT